MQLYQQLRESGLQYGPAFRCASEQLPLCCCACLLCTCQRWQLHEGTAVSQPRVPALPCCRLLRNVHVPDVASA